MKKKNNNIHLCLQVFGLPELSCFVTLLTSFFVLHFPPPGCLWPGPTTQKTKKTAFKSIFPLPSTEQAIGAVAKHRPASSPVSRCVHVVDRSCFVPVLCDQSECGFCVCGDMFSVRAVGDRCLVDKTNGLWAESQSGQSMSLRLVPVGERGGGVEERMGGSVWEEQWQRGWGGGVTVLLLFFNFAGFL